MKNNTRKKPIVFVPGLFGSMSNIIIPSTGDWNFGISAFVYEPFIMMLENMGYERNKNLFISFYDWRQRIQTAAQNYLLKTINLAKHITGSHKVNLKRYFRLQTYKKGCGTIPHPFLLNKIPRIIIMAKLINRN